MKSIGLIPLSAKPYHAGHDGLVRIAADENDEVLVFVSTKDRIRKGEVPIKGSTMMKIWKKFIEPTLPSNVKVVYIDIPVSGVYNEIEAAEAKGSTDTYKIYSDVEDILKFKDESLSKSAPNLFNNKQIIRRGVERTETVPVSGTAMRQYLKSNDIDMFVAMLPPAIQNHGHEIFDMLKASLSESLLKKYIRHTLKNLI